MPYHPRLRLTPEQVLDLRLGSRPDWLPNWGERVRQALDDSAMRTELVSTLMNVICDTQNLMVAFEHVRDLGGDAPGPDGLTLQDFTLPSAGQVSRVLRDAMRSERYRTAMPRQVRMPKGPGRGDRTLSLFNVWDRVVHRAIQQVLQPLLDPSFSRFSLGGRPQKSVLHGLLELERQVIGQGMNWLVTDDLRDAFDRVPLGRLRGVLGRYIQNTQVVNLIVATWGTPTPRRGIAQGSPLSGLLLNVYLDHFVDRRWSTSHRHTRMLRYIDDFLLVGGDADQVNHAHQSLVNTLRVAGLPVKRACERAVDLNSGTTVEWLGFTITKQDDRLLYGLPANWHEHLKASLLDCHARANSCELACASILGWARAYGPVWATTGREDVYRQIVSVAATCGFREVTSASQFSQACRQARQAWRQLQRSYPPDGAEVDARRDRASRVPSRRNSLRRHTDWHLVTDGSCLRHSRVGGCAFELCGFRRRTVRAAFAARRTTNNRAELKAVILGLKRVGDGESVMLTTDSAYVADAVNRYIDRWRVNQWRTRRNRLVENLDLIQELAGELQRCSVYAVRIDGDCGDSVFERVDREANRAACTLERRLGID